MQVAVVWKSMRTEPNARSGMSGHWTGWPAMSDHRNTGVIRILCNRSIAVSAYAEGECKKVRNHTSCNLYILFPSCLSYEALMSLEDHLEVRINTPIYQVLKVNLVTYIRNILGLKQFDEHLILKIAAILDTNCFEIRPHQKNTKLRAVYPMAAMISHDCVPNTRHVFDEHMQMSVLATGKHMI